VDRLGIDSLVAAQSLWLKTRLCGGLQRIRPVKAALRSEARC